MQVVLASKSWISLPTALRPNSNLLFSSLLKSKADSTAKKYVCEIKKFFAWCKRKQIGVQLPFSTPILALYFFELNQQLKSPASLTVVHAALKWLHFFIPEDGHNPLDNACCKNLIECPNDQGASL